MLYDCSVRDHIPLEQGLRQEIVSSVRYLYRVRDHIPLEQGLRHLEAAKLAHCSTESETIFH